MNRVLRDALTDGACMIIGIVLFWLTWMVTP